ncbi:hypothetical protein T440DRAFT_398352 [Plenodomus tracheiphilus IPT5]|uniref:DNA replication checkpoint mediator MRC1 domain-containing protein n=1 Tax=Plenodomus tracheiphilus IPT5 TaxID=1408161 RepID=A0A6A7B3L1_9PLEO|nr:hypothetical protein T440DRAFT_398352 [Plenodomus tracheiphilus IPT5]
MASISPKSTRSSPSLRPTDASAAPRPKLLAALRKASAGSSDSETESENAASASEDETPAVPLRTEPMGSPRLNADSAGEDEESDGENAYARMKKLLAADKKVAESRTAEQEAPIMADIASTDDEDEIPVRTSARATTTRGSKTVIPPASPSPSIRSRRSSPGLFVTPNATPVKQSRRSVGTGSGSDNSPRPSRSNDLQDRVRRIRAERLARERKEQEESQKTLPKKIARRRADQESGSESDGENGRRLTQQARPTRKAGKKAMEEMARDQQRISRNMQLTHQAKTKKRFTTKDLFAKMGYNVPNDGLETLPTPDTSSALASSDAEPAQMHESPLAEPQEEADMEDKQVLPMMPATGPEQHTKVLDMPLKLDKGKGRAPEFQHLPVNPWMEQAKSIIVQNATVQARTSSKDTMIELSDSDDDVQITQPKSRFPVFDRLPTKKQHESASLQHLRSLAQLIKPAQNGKKGQKSANLAEWEFSLAQKARQQAHQAREAKIADMIARGAHVETEEEREKRQEAIEDLVAQMEKEREQDLKLAKVERSEAKKNGETLDDLPSSDEEDDDYVGSGEENAKDDDDNEELDVELSGSEDELMEDEDEDQTESNYLGDDAAEVDDEPEVADELQQIDEDADGEDEDAIARVRKQNVNRARKRVIDDDDESDTEVIQNFPTQQSTQSDAMAAFGFGNAVPDVGLTQMFAGTMAELESGSQSTPAPGYETEQNSLDFLRSLPDTQPGANFCQTEDVFVPNSQTLTSPQKESQSGADSQFSLGISQFVKTSPAFARTQVEDFEPTQDAGFSFSRSPAGLVLPASTVETVIMPVAESPIKRRQGKLQRGRQDAPVELSDVEDDLAGDEAEESEDDIQLPPKPRDAFSKLQKGAKKQKAIDDFNKNTSMAKDAVMEQAEESEDEYAGVGGVSDDEEGEEEQELKDMIDHADVDVDERQLAAFYADKAKKDDEKNIADLYKKIQTGGLRRHAGAPGFDMSDSEDEAEIRQRKKRAAFQQQTRALLADDRVKALHDDQKKKAFFNSLADFADEGDYDFLDMPADLGVDGADSQSQETPKGSEDMDDIIPDSQSADTVAMPAPSNPLKRKSPESSQKENRPPPNLRRTAASDNLTRKPITLADVQNSVSELLDDPRIIIPDSQFSESEDDDTPALNAASRRPIVDRLSLSRQSTMEEMVGGDANLAFHAPSRSAAIPGFRVPSLIRQATSNLSTTSQRSSGANTTTESVRRGGTGKSNIHAQAREAERRALLERKEAKRKEALRKKVEGGRKRAGGMRSVLGDLGGGFE